MNDGQAIRAWFETWRQATLAGDVQQLIDLCADDAVFLQPGRPPMRGADTFAAAFRSAISQFCIDYTSTIEEIRIHGDHAHCWTTLAVTITPRTGGEPVHRAGNTLTVFEKRNGGWLLSRDANMLVTVPQV
ncbi:YybH family protein [Andreprevotia chitinilytica]|uniref:YybH family protein n=1 Tax=Andreprevotia chitinilytica TaxID=396808 RepID=UPI001B801FDF|nr:nuclear transport factor 2 family protein [Andreprevotia chitinilytica]